MFAFHVLTIFGEPGLGGRDIYKRRFLNKQILNNSQITFVFQLRNVTSVAAVGRRPKFRRAVWSY